MSKDVSNHESFELPNGLRVVLYKLESVKSVYMVCHLASGNAFAKKGQIGTAHFLEHLSFCSTKKFKTRKSILEALYKIGAQADANSASLSTNYWLKCPSVNINKALDIFHQIIFRVNINEKDVEGEKKVILNEFEDFQSNDNSVFLHLIHQNRFKNLPQYQTRPMGDSEKIKSLNADKLQTWAKKFINPANAVLTIAGNYNENRLKEQVKKIFGQDKKGERFGFPHFKKEHYSNFLIYQKERSVNQVWFDLNWPSFGWQEKDRKQEITISMLYDILGYGPFSRLNLNIREKKNLAYYIKTYSVIFPYLGYLGVSGSVSREKLIDTLKEIKKEIDSICKSGVTQKEFEMTKKYWAFQNMMLFETPESIAYFLGGQMFDYGKTWLQEDYTKKRNEIKLPEIKSMANEIFDHKKININLDGNLSASEMEKVGNIFQKR